MIRFGVCQNFDNGSDWDRFLAWEAGEDAGPQPYSDAALMEETMKLAHELANGPTIALSLIRKLYWESPGNSFEEQLDLEQRLQREAGSAEDFKEGVTAFLEKRPAKFKGK